MRYAAAAFPPHPRPPTRIRPSLGFRRGSLGPGLDFPGTGFRVWLGPAHPLASRGLEVRGTALGVYFVSGSYKCPTRRVLRTGEVWGLMIRDTGVRVPHNIKPRCLAKPEHARQMPLSRPPLPAPPNTGAGGRLHEPPIRARDPTNSQLPTGRDIAITRAGQERRSQSRQRNLPVDNRRCGPYAAEADPGGSRV